MLDNQITDMKKETEKNLTAYSALVTRDTSAPESPDEPEMTDEQIEALGSGEGITLEQTSDTYRAACSLLESLKAEMPYFQQVAEQNRIPLADEADERIEKGLTTEINRSTALVSVTDTMENIVALLARHPYGYKQGSRDRKGKVVIEPYTAAENLAAEKWLASLNNGSPVVADEEAD